MKITRAFKDAVVSLYRSLKRFPVTILLSALVAAMLIVVNELQATHNTSVIEILNRVTLILALGIPLSLCVKLLFERKSDSKVYELIIYYVAGALILLLYYFFFLQELNMVSITRYVAVSLALYLGFLFIPYFFKKEQFEMYTIKIFISFFITVIYSAVLYMGLSAILFTIDKLLSIHVAGKVYYYTFLFVVFVFASPHFLANIPLKNQQYTWQDYPKILRILILYIVMPILTAYTTILYIYFVKIIVTRTWPVGLVSHLVLWYSVIVAMVLFLITPLKDENKWANKFLFWSPKVIIPILMMMFVSIGIRVNAYGVTENRYFVIILGLWVLGVMIYFSIAKKHRNILIPVTLSIIALVSVFGPLSSYSISKASQNNRFEKILLRNDMLSQGQIQAAPSTISKEDKYEISRILDYFRSSHSLEDIKCIPENFIMEDTGKVFGFAYESPQYGSQGGYFYYLSEDAIDISGYYYLFDNSSLHNKSAATHNGNEINVIYNPESSVIKIDYKGDTVYHEDLTHFVEDIVEKYGVDTKGKNLPNEDMILTEENQEIKVKIVFRYISGNKDISSGRVRVDGVEFYILVKTKE